MRWPDNLGVLESREELPEWLPRLAHGPLAVDTETTGLRWDRDRVGGLCLAAGRSAIYARGDALFPAVRWLADQVRRRRELVFHNGKFDLHMLRGTFGLHVPYPVHDTMIQSFLIDNRGAPVMGQSYHGGHGLKNLAAAFVDPEAHAAEDEVLAAAKLAGGKNKGDLLLAPPEIGGKYGALDAWYTLRLHGMQLERIKHWRQPDDEDYPSLMSLYETERWLLLALRDMEERGIVVNVPFLEKWRDELGRKLKREQRELARLAGREINWNSAPQLRELLYKTLRQPVTRMTDGGKKKIPMPSTDAVALLKMRHPIGASLLRYREDLKQYTGYAINLLESVWPDGAIHPHFKQIGAETGRLSCEDPNMQQQTRESGVRDAYHARRGLQMRFADYSQIEMRFGAHFAEEPTLIKGFNDDPDFDTHQATAQKMYGVKEPTKQQRKFGKIMNFTLIFGGGEDKVTEQLVNLLELKDAVAGCREFGYKPRASESPHRALAQLLRGRYFEELPNMRRAVRSEAEIAEARGFVMNAFGRHRYLDDEKWYKAFNTRVQGSAADQAKKGLVAMYRELQLSEGTIALMLQIHDEAVYESDGDPRTDRRALELLKDTTSFRVPIIADMSGSRTTWQRKEKVKL